MDKVTIYTTDEAAARFEQFAHGDVVHVFSHLTAEGPRKLIEGPLWAFVDWAMPEISGLEMCRRLRADPRTAHAHVTIVLEQDDAEDRRRALRAGADDYAVGPLSRQAILDRVLALNHGAVHSGSVPVVHAGDFEINVGGEQARWRGKLIPLRPNEFRVLRLMVENPNRVLSRQELVDALGKDGDPNYLRTVDVWIKRLRFGLRGVGASHLLRTVHAKGYVLDIP